MIIEIRTEYIKLDSAIKYAGISENGAEAKEFIKDGLVKSKWRNRIKAWKKAL